MIFHDYVKLPEDIWLLVLNVLAVHLIVISTFSTAIEEHLARNCPSTPGQNLWNVPHEIVEFNSISGYKHLKYLRSRLHPDVQICINAFSAKEVNELGMLVISMLLLRWYTRDILIPMISVWSPQNLPDMLMEDDGGGFPRCWIPKSPPFSNEVYTQV